MLNSIFGIVQNVLSPGSGRDSRPVESVQAHDEAACSEGPSTAIPVALATTPANLNRHYTCGVVYDAVMELHLRAEHPEHPNRVLELNRKLDSEGLLANCHTLASKLASTEELLKCHSQAHIDRVDHLSINPVNTNGEPAQQEGDAFIISGDIYCNQHTKTAARSAAGCSIQAVEAVLSGKVDNAFAIVRPPGHHAEPEEFMGFCFYNNVGVAAQAALSHPGIERVLILDWDIHHGNGTQKMFEEDPRVLFISLHRRDKDFYPKGCGFPTEVGKGPGEGYTVNVGWPGKGMGDADYLAAFDLILDPIIKQFDPQLVLVSAGFDAAEGDLLGLCHVTPAGFAAMTQRLMQYAGGKLVAVLEGGYMPRIVGECAAEVMRVMQGAEPAPLPKSSCKLHRGLEAVLSNVDAIQRKYWSDLAGLPPFADRYKLHCSTLKLHSLSLSSSSPVASKGPATRATTRAASAAAATGLPAQPGAIQHAAAAEERTAAAAECKAAAAGNTAAKAESGIGAHRSTSPTTKGGCTASPAVSAASPANSRNPLGVLTAAGPVAEGTDLLGRFDAAASPSLSAAARPASFKLDLSDEGEEQPPVSTAATAVEQVQAVASSVAQPGGSGKALVATPTSESAESQVSSQGSAALLIIPVAGAASGGATEVAQPLSAHPAALERAASAKARAEKLAEAAAQRKARVERQAALREAKTKALAEKRWADMQARRAAIQAAADAEEQAAKAAAAAGADDESNTPPAAMTTVNAGTVASVTPQVTPQPAAPAVTHTLRRTPPSTVVASSAVSKSPQQMLQESFPSPSAQPKTPASSSHSGSNKLSKSQTAVSKSPQQMLEESSPGAQPKTPDSGSHSGNNRIFKNKTPAAAQLDSPAEHGMAHTTRSPTKSAAKPAAAAAAEKQHGASTTIPVGTAVATAAAAIGHADAGPDSPATGLTNALSGLSVSENHPNVRSSSSSTGDVGSSGTATQSRSIAPDSPGRPAPSAVVTAAGLASAGKWHVNSVLSPRGANSNPACGSQAAAVAKQNAALMNGVEGSRARSPGPQKIVKAAAAMALPDDDM